MLEVADANAASESRRYSLPAGHDEVLLDRDSLSYMTGLARLAVGAASPLQALVAAYRSGDGVPYASYGADARDGIADIGCGTGWSSIALARAYARARVDGLDLDEASIASANRNAEQAGVADRVRFEVRDAADPRLIGRYDVVTAFETIHDMARPVEALRTMRGMLAEGGSVLIADERVAETFSAPAGEMDRFNYGWSILHCLPASRTEPASAGTGTVMRPETLRRYATEAGFSEFEVLPIDHDAWRFYRLVP